MTSEKEFFLDKGFAVYKDLLDQNLLKKCQEWFNLLTQIIKPVWIRYTNAFENEQNKGHRHDLGEHVESGIENLSQLMWPSLYVPELQQVIDKCVTISKVSLRPMTFYKKQLDSIFELNLGNIWSRYGFWLRYDDHEKHKCWNAMAPR